MDKMDAVLLLLISILTLIVILIGIQQYNTYNNVVAKSYFSGKANGYSIGYTDGYDHSKKEINNQSTKFQLCKVLE